MATVAGAAQVLIVEDDLFCRSALRKLVSMHGLQTMEAATVAMGRRAVAAFAFQLIIVDQHLPDGTGLSVCEYALNLRPEGRAVLMTGAFYPELLEKTLRAQGMRQTLLDFWIKPIDAARVRQCLDMVFPATGQKSP